MPSAGSDSFPEFAELRDLATVVSLPLNTRFRGLTTREAVILRGPLGATEFSPFVEYNDVEAATWLAAALDFGWREQPARVRSHIRVNATVPAVAASAVSGVLARFPGCRTAKVKVAERGQTLADERDRLREVRALLGKDGRIRIDANAGWTVDEAEHAIRSLAEFDLEYVEQPCASVAELAEIRERIADLGILIAADESVRKATDPLAVARAGAADLLIIKAQPLGGVMAATAIAAEAGLPVVVSSALDTSVGISMGAWLAGSLPALDFDCGLGTVSLFAADVAVTPLRPVAGSIPVERVTLDDDTLDRHRAAPEREAWWMERLRACLAVLDADR